MTVNPIGSTTTAYAVSTTSVSSTTPTGSTTASSSTTASTTASSTTSSTMVNYSSATASTTCSTTISYSSASTTASVSSTTSSSTAVSNVAGSAIDTSSVSPYPYILHFGDEGLAEVKKALFSLGFCDSENDEEWERGLELFKYASGLSEYDTYGAEVAQKLSEASTILGDEDNWYVTREKLEKIGFHKLTDNKVRRLNFVLYQFGITEKNEIDHFLTQTYHESYFGWNLTEINWTTGYNNQDEEVNRKYFNEKYATRNGNQGGDDGYNYRGAGYIQLTGRANYTNFLDYIGDSDVLNVGADYVAEYYAWEAAGWFWKEYVHSYFEGESEPTVAEITKRIVGSSNDAAQREETYNKIKELE